MSRTLRVVKMSGAGNDFLLLDSDAAAQIGEDLADWARRACRRGVSVGSDGVLLVEPLGSGRVRVRFFNPDGSGAFCGNGSRCAARYAHSRGMAPAAMVLETEGGDVPAEVRGDRVQLRLPPPRYDGEITLDVGCERLPGRCIDSGTPHFVVFAEDPAKAPLERWGPIVRRHPQFAPRGVNLDVVGVATDSARLRTWEKGVEGETLACGSGAVAAAVAIRRSKGDRPDAVTLVPASGIPLRVAFGPGGAITLEGDARFIFDGRLSPEALLPDEA